MLVNGIALALAWSTRSIAALVFALLATLLTAGLWIVTAPPVHESVTGMLTVVGGFGVFFATASTFLTAHVSASANTDARSHVPAIAAAMPFVLLLMLVAKLPIPNPTLVFIVALVMAVVLLGLGIVAEVELDRGRSRWRSRGRLNANGIACISRRRARSCRSAGTWRSCFSSPPIRSFLERGTLVRPVGGGRSSGLLHFWLIYELIAERYPHLRNGLLPAAVHSAVRVRRLASRRAARRRQPASGDARLAWQGGAALLFLSLIFPVQFEREWITLGWAVEGLLLLVLVSRRAECRVCGSSAPRS